MKNDNMFYYNKYNNKYSKYISKHSGVNSNPKRNQNLNKEMNDHQVKDKTNLPSNIRLTPIFEANNKFFKSHKDSNKLKSLKKSAFAKRKIESSLLLQRNSNINSMYYIQSIIFIQYMWRQYYSRINKKATIIQSVFYGYLIRKYLKEIQIEIKKKIKAIHLITMVMFKNYLNVKYQKEHKVMTDQAFYSKIIRLKIILEIIRIQIKYREYLRYKAIPKKIILNRHYLIKDGICLINKIKKIQTTFKDYLRQMETRKKIVKEFRGIKITRPIFKIILLQRFFRYIIHKKKTRPLINKNNFISLYYFSKETIITSITLLPNTDINIAQNSFIPIKTKIKKKRTRFTKQLSHQYYSKLIQPITKIKIIQKSIRKRLRREAYYLPQMKKISLLRKKLFYQSYYIPIKLIQRQVRYLFFRIDNKLKIINKQILPPMKYTKVLITAFKKLFSRAIKVRLDFDKELINFVLTMHMLFRKYYAHLFFQLIDWNSQSFKKSIKSKKVVVNKRKDSLIYPNTDPIDEFFSWTQSNIIQSSNSEMNGTFFINKSNCIEKSRNHNKATYEKPKSELREKHFSKINDNKNNKRIFIELKPELSQLDKQTCLIRTIYNKDNYENILNQ